MYSWVEEGQGLMFEQKLGDQTVQMVFIVLGKDTAYGASSAEDPDFVADVPLMHPMTYFIYKEVQKRGVKYYDVGDTTYRDSLFRTRTDKEKTICDFKRGFGQRSFPLKRWIWFATRADEIAYLERQLAAYRSKPLSGENFSEIDQLPSSWIDGELERS